MSVKLTVGSMRHGDEGHIQEYLALMPDVRKHRGPNPRDSQYFAAENLPTIRCAGSEYTWLLSRGYADRSALKLVGDRHKLTDRQRMALWRSACSDAALTHRRSHEVTPESCANEPVAVDGYNVLITVESALSGGIVLIGRDGCCRDLAGLHGTYRKVEETLPALDLIASELMALGVGRVDWYLDKPVSNSGRLKVVMADALERKGWLNLFNIELVDSPDGLLARHGGIAVTADGPVLDRCARWLNLARRVIGRIEDAWVIDLWNEDGSHPAIG